MDWVDGLTLTKDPNATKDWRWDFAEWIADGDSIQSHVVVADAGITVETSVHDATGVRVWLSGGTVGQTYAVTVRATMLGGAIEDKTVRFLIDEQ